MPDHDSPLIRPGDQLQSSASRMAEWIRKIDATSPGFVPYEVHMAVLEAEAAVHEWTGVRCG